MTSPVRFMEAVDAAVADGVDLWLEVGPGQTLCGLIGEFRNEPAVALDAGGTSIRGLLSAAGACFCLGARIAHDELFADRFARPFDLDWRPRFFTNPCELAPLTTRRVSNLRERDSPQTVPRTVRTHPLSQEVLTVSESKLTRRWKLLDDLWQSGLNSPSLPLRTKAAA